MITTKCKGGKQLEAAFRELGDAGASSRLARRALRKVAEPVRDKAQRLAPKDEGILEDAIAIGTRVSSRAKRVVGREQPGTVRVFVGIDQNKPQEVNIYSVVQEFGNPSTAAQPYFRTAWNSEGRKATVRLAPILWDDLDRTAKRLAKKRAKA